MAKCLKCNKEGFVWKYNYVVAKNQLFDPETVDWHNRVCHMNKLEYDEVKQSRYLTKSCRHGILLDAWCDMCAEERR